MIRCVVLLVLGSVLGGTSVAQVPRLFPSAALRGELSGTAPPDVLLNGRPARLAPGARIRSEENRFEVTGTLQGRTLLVNYTTDPGGQLLEIWILTPAERANVPWPMSAGQAAAWRFDPVAQKWSLP
jgi:hypothetical protein